MYHCEKARIKEVYTGPYKELKSLNWLPKRPRMFSLHLHSWMHNWADNSTATYVIIFLMTVCTIACNYCYADIQTPPHDLLFVQAYLSNMHS